MGHWTQSLSEAFSAASALPFGLFWALCVVSVDGAVGPRSLAGKYSSSVSNSAAASSSSSVSPVTGLISWSWVWTCGSATCKQDETKRQERIRANSTGRNARRLLPFTAWAFQLPSSYAENLLDILWLDQFIFNSFLELLFLWHHIQGGLDSG